MRFGYYVIFTSSTSYLVDTFQRWGASALAANTFARSVFAAGLPLAVPYMYARLGNGWAFSVLGFFAVLNIPMPFVFWIYGAQIRKMVDILPTWDEALTYWWSAGWARSETKYYKIVYDKYLSSNEVFEVRDIKGLIGAIDPKEATTYLVRDFDPGKRCV